MLLLRFGLIFLILGSANSFPQQSSTEPTVPEGLGKITFPNSCAAGAQPAFLKGVAQLHSFQYAAAERAFTEAAQADPQCAMAYWGLAMSVYHPLWEGAGQKALMFT